MSTVKTEVYALAEKMNGQPEHIENEKDRVFQVDLAESGSIQLLLTQGRITVSEDLTAEPDVTLKLSDANFSKLLKDDLNTTMAFMTGKLKVEGQLGLALKFQEILKHYQ